MLDCTKRNQLLTVYSNATSMLSMFTLLIPNNMLSLAMLYVVCGCVYCVCLGVLFLCVGEGRFGMVRRYIALRKKNNALSSSHFKVPHGSTVLL